MFLKVLFLHLFVSHSVHRRGVCLSACWDTTPPPKQQAPPGTRHPPPGADPPGADTPLEQTPPGPGTPLEADTPSPQSRPPREQTTPPGRRLPLRTVRNLLECILVEVWVWTSINLLTATGLGFLPKSLHK